MSPDLKGGEIQPLPVERIAPTHSLVYKVETGELIEIGPAGTDWGSGVHAHESRPEESVSEELQAERDKFDVQEIALTEETAEVYKALSKGGGGDGIDKNALAVAADMPVMPVAADKSRATPAVWEQMIAQASAEVLASRKVGG